MITWILKHYQQITMTIEKVINIKKLSTDNNKEDLVYWMSKSPQERIEAIEYLRRMYYGDSTRLQRAVRIVQRS